MTTDQEVKMPIRDFANDLTQARHDPANWRLWLVLLEIELERQTADLK